MLQALTPGPSPKFGRGVEAQALVETGVRPLSRPGLGEKGGRGDSEGQKHDFSDTLLREIPQ